MPPWPKRSDPRLPGFRNIFLFNSTLHKGTKEIFKTQENSISEPQHETKGLAAADTDVVYDVLERVGKRGERRERRKAFISSLKYAHSPTRGAAKIFPQTAPKFDTFTMKLLCQPCPCDPSPGQREDEIQWLPNRKAGFAWFWWEFKVKKSAP